MSSSALQPSGGPRHIRNLDALRKRRAVDQDDVYIALALQPSLDAAGQSELDRILFATGKRRRQVSSAPYTPASVLERMTRSNDDAKLNLRLARHPATPGEALHELVERSEAMPLIEAVAAHGNASTDLLAGLPWRDSAALQTALCSNPNTGRETLADIAAEASSLTLQKEIAGHRNAGADLLRETLGAA